MADRWAFGSRVFEPYVFGTGALAKVPIEGKRTGRSIASWAYIPGSSDLNVNRFESDVYNPGSEAQDVN